MADEQSPYAKFQSVFQAELELLAQTLLVAANKWKDAIPNNWVRHTRRSEDRLASCVGPADRFVALGRRAAYRKARRVRRAARLDRRARALE